MFATTEITMSIAAMITLFSMGVVFAALYVICLILELFGKIFGKKTTKIVINTPVEDENIPAVIMAAIYEYEQSQRVNPIARGFSNFRKNVGPAATNSVSRNCQR